MERVKINYRFVRLPKLENGCFLRVWCQSHVIGNMCPNHPDYFGIACPLFYQRDTIFTFSGFFLSIPSSFWSVDRLLVSLTFSLFLPASVLTALSLPFYLFSLSSVSPAHTFLHWKVTEVGTNSSANFSGKTPDSAGRSHQRFTGRF